jgi:hypothetical protein
MKPAVANEAELWVRNLWADGDNRNPVSHISLASRKFALPHAAMNRHDTRPLRFVPAVMTKM